MAEAEATALAKPDDGTRTSPNVPPAPHDAKPTRPLTLSEEQVALRPSPRFESMDALARLAVFPTDASETKSRAGWTVPVAKMKRRRSPAFSTLLVAWSVALLAAIAIALF